MIQKAHDVTDSHHTEYPLKSLFDSFYRNIGPPDGTRFFMRFLNFRRLAIPGKGHNLIRQVADRRRTEAIDKNQTPYFRCCEYRSPPQFITRATVARSEPGAFHQTLPQAARSETGYNVCVSFSFPFGMHAVSRQDSFLPCG
jgi:hypothetical protein